MGGEPAAPAVSVIRDTKLHDPLEGEVDMSPPSMSSRCSGAPVDPDVRRRRLRLGHL
ncbi:MAG: hypothetical protein U5K37_12955 [Natrialbaceae archaeon]|nr:hypothetical protein [Natrialbaceae archaeon]